MTTAQKIVGRTENEVNRYFGQCGYWKQRIAMKLSRIVGSLKLAWKIVNYHLNKPKQGAGFSDNWVELITQGLENGSQDPYKESQYLRKHQIVFN